MKKLFETNFDFEFTRLLLQRSIGSIYLIGFVILFNQAVPLLEKKEFCQRISSSIELLFGTLRVFSFIFSDTFLDALSFLGIILSFICVIGFTEKSHPTFNFLCWFYLWFIYLSFINIGQVFYGYGWETMLVETGFLSIF